MKHRVLLGVNVDHIGTLREARATAYPEPIIAALLAQQAGCDSIVMHLREDFRHVKERDLFLGLQKLKIPLNMEMAINPWVVDYAYYLRPACATLVPERRQELTTEGGLDLTLPRSYKKIERVVKHLQSIGITVSLFIDPDRHQIDLAKKMKADHVELHTGKFCSAVLARIADKEFHRLRTAARYASNAGFFVAAGHGVNYENAKALTAIKEIQEFNIGHAIVCQAVITGMVSAVKEMISLINS